MTVKRLQDTHSKGYLQTAEWCQLGTHCLYEICQFESLFRKTTLLIDEAITGCFIRTNFHEKD